MGQTIQQRVLTIAGSILLTTGMSGNAFALITEQTCSTPTAAIPDHDGTTVSGSVTDTISLGSANLVSAMEISLDVDHTWLGDLTVQLQHDAGTTVTLLQRPGLSGLGDCNAAGVNGIFKDAALASVEETCPSAAEANPAVSGDFTPVTADFLANFDGDMLAGPWNLTITDNFPQDTGTLNEWCITTPYVCNDAAMPYTGGNIEAADTLVCNLSVTPGVFARGASPAFDVAGMLTINSVPTVDIGGVAPIGISGDLILNAVASVSIDGPFSVTGTLRINMGPLAP